MRNLTTAFWGPENANLKMGFKVHVFEKKRKDIRVDKSDRVKMSVHIHICKILSGSTSSVGSPH